jgi:predicted nucleic acid-binding protein
MSAPDFLDTNILVYAYDPSDPTKQRVAQEFLLRALDGGIVTSTQILAEFVATLLHKLSPPASPQDVLAILDALSPLKVISPDSATIRRAVEARAQNGIHFYDAMIVSAAERAACGRILSEDLNAGQSYFSIPVHNPFA